MQSMEQTGVGRKFIAVEIMTATGAGTQPGASGLLSIREGSQVAIIGDNAEGKTQLVDLMLGARRERGVRVRYDFSDTGSNYISDNVRYISFRDSYGAADASYYLQLRWNQMEIDEETPTVRDMLERVAGKPSVAGAEAGTTVANPMHERMLQLCRHFGLEPLLDKVIITLSSGELRKYQLVKSLLCSPRMLIMDNPFIGLDNQTRLQLSELFAELAGEGLTIVLVLSRSEEIPSFIDTVIPVVGMLPQAAMSPAEWLAEHPVPERPERRFVEDGLNAAAPEDGSGSEAGLSTSDEVLRFRDVSIRYGDRTILDKLRWTVRRGEHWALTGENGSGKSTLLSIVCADNPQAYACDIDLFGRRRGTGETIWDIKKHIGYVSPEMHRSYCRDIPAGDIVASGLFDTIGLYVRPTEAQRASCMGWMERFGIAGLADRSFVKLSSGEQRLCLLARAFVKNPDLLILDEPMHGLDESRRDMVRRIIDDYCADTRVTLVMVTHYLEELPSFVDRRLVLQRR